jgi:serine/threonine protein kinase
MMLNKRYKLIEQIGNGSFGILYKGKHNITGNYVAIKMENIMDGINMLKNETKIYQYLKGVNGVPSILYFGIHENRYYMVLPLLGKSLREIREINGPFSLPDILTICNSIINILELIHDKGLIHRDIKPDNFLIGNGNSINIIDFGFCKKYLNKDGKHIGLKENRGLIGSLNYMSINIHNGIEASRRDDLESIGYMMLYFLGIPYEATSLSKLNVIENGNIPDIIQQYFISCFKLKFDERPYYSKYIIVL